MSSFVLINQTPNVPTELADFAREHDPHFDLAGMHTTLIFPTPSEIGADKLIKHVQDVLNNWQPFPVRYNTLEKSWDNWLFITPTEGGEGITKLHDELYEGIMKPYLREDLPFIPHLGLGLFIKEGSDYDVRNPEKAEFDTEAYDKALAWAKGRNIDISYVFKTCVLLEINDEFTEAKEIKEFSL